MPGGLEPLISVKEIIAVYLQLDPEPRAVKSELAWLSNGCVPHQIRFRDRATAARGHPCTPISSMRLKLISCDIFEREVKAAAARSSNQIELEFLPKALHQLSDREKVRSLQGLICRAHRRKFHAVLLVTGSCKEGLAGLRAGSIPLVVPRAKDCISLMLQRPKPALPRPLEQAQAAVGSARSRQSPPQDGRTHAPVWAPPAPPRLDAIRMPFPVETWNWRERFRPLSSPDNCPGECRRNQTCSTLELLVNGYWNYTEFLVVAPRWRVIIGQDGAISAKE